MIRFILNAIRSDDRSALEAFHRAEMRDAGVSEHAFRAFVAGR